MPDEVIRLDTAAFGSVVSFLRKYRGWTQAKLAELCGTHETRISNWEKGKQMPRDDSVRKLAKGFGVSVAALFGLQNALLTHVKNHPADFEAFLSRAADRKSGEVGEAPLRYEAEGPPELRERWRELALERGAIEERQVLLIRDTLTGGRNKDDPEKG